MYERLQFLPDGFIFEGLTPLNLKHMVFSGQAFRWEQKDKDSYVTVVKDRVIQGKQENDKLLVRLSALKDPLKDLAFVSNFFDLNTDYKNIEESLSQDPKLRQAVLYSSGNRIFKQDPWECIISYIISQNNSITNITRVIKRICKRYGPSLSYDGQKYYMFPRPEILADLKEIDLKECKAGYRCKYIIESSRKIADKEVDLEKIKEMQTSQAREELKKLPGVGDKVADCILLFAFQKYDSFPVDVWIKRAVEKLYFGGQKQKITTIQEFAAEKFKHMAGFVNQYLFLWARHNL